MYAASMRCLIRSVLSGGQAYQSGRPYGTKPNILNIRHPFEVSGLFHLAQNIPQGDWLGSSMLPDSFRRQLSGSVRRPAVWEFSASLTGSLSSSCWKE